MTVQHAPSIPALKRQQRQASLREARLVYIVSIYLEKKIDGR